MGHPKKPRYETLQDMQTLELSHLGTLERHFDELVAQYEALAEVIAWTRDELKYHGRSLNEIESEMVQIENEEDGSL